MGSFLSFPANKSQEKPRRQTSPAQFSSKRLKLSSSFHCGDESRLIPSLPDEVSHLILARISRISYLRLRSVSRSWKAALSSSEIYHLRRELGTTEEWLYILTKLGEEKLIWHALDPSTGIWQRLPPMPAAPPPDENSGRKALVWVSSIRIADMIRGWLGRRDALDILPFCGCAIGASAGRLYVLGGFSRALAMRCVWRYDPADNSWGAAPSMITARAFSKASILNDKLYVVGGVSKGRGGLAPLQSGEVYDPKTDAWTELKSMPFTKAQTLPTAFLAELLKPIATGMTSFRGRLCVPQSLYSWPFFVDVGGEIYDPEADSWADMPAGMGEGWPARQAGTKLSVVVNGELYALEPSSSLDSGKIKMYDRLEDAWKVVVGRVPVHDFTDSETPYLLAGIAGKLHVITKEADNRTAVFQANLTRRKCASGSSEIHGSDACWTVIAGKNFGAAELAGCLVLDV